MKRRRTSGGGTLGRGGSNLYGPTPRDHAVSYRYISAFLLALSSEPIYSEKSALALASRSKTTYGNVKPGDLFVGQFVWSFRLVGGGADVTGVLLVGAASAGDRAGVYL